MRTQSAELFARARRVIPGGVNSPVRAGLSVRMDPPFISRASGALLWDADGQCYIDYVGSWGPMILGHAHEAVVRAVQEAAAGGTSYGAPTRLEVEMAECIASLVPSMERVRMVNSGTEATMSAVRLARAFTGREKIVKFDGCYHGHADSLLVQAGSGVATLGIPGSPGVPEVLARLTLSLPFNDGAAIEAAFARYGADIAAVIVEPVPGNMGVVLPQPGYLETLRRVTRERGALLIFDEVMTGFRVGMGGAQSVYGIVPDLTCLGKIIGGGLPVGAYGGRKDIMGLVAPEGPVYQAGTLSGNPLAMAAGLATLRILRDTDPYPELDRRSERLFSGLARAAEAAGIPLTLQRRGSMGSFYFSRGPIGDFASAKASDQERFIRFYQGMLARGIYLAPSAFEATFISTAHEEALITRTIEAAGEVVNSLSRL